MPKIHEMTDSKFLRKEDVGDGEIVVTIRKIGKANVAMEDQPPELKWVIAFAEFRKPMVLNATNIQILAKACGSEDTDDWINKRVMLFVDENVTFGGKLVGGLRVRAVRKPPTTPMDEGVMMMDVPRGGATHRQMPGDATPRHKVGDDDLEDDIPWQQ